MAFLESVTDLCQVSIARQEKRNLKLKMSSSVQVADSYTFVLNNNKTLDKQYTDDYWIFFAKGNRNSAEANLLNFLNGIGVDFGVEIKFGDFVNWGQYFLNLNFANHKSSGHHVGERVIKSLHSFRHTVMNFG